MAANKNDNQALSDEEQENTLPASDDAEVAPVVTPDEETGVAESTSDNVEVAPVSRPATLAECNAMLAQQWQVEATSKGKK